MSAFRIHTVESAPAASRQSLETLQKNFGLIPNLAATMAESPTLVNGFVGAFVNFSGGTFSAAERQVLLLTNAVTNRSEWAVAFHSTAALKEGVDAADVLAIRDGRTVSTPRLNALSTLSRRCIELRGKLADNDIAAFTNAGFTHAQILEVMAGNALSTMANYAGNITHPPLEAPFKAQEWKSN
ncbi:MAG: carboxymuconolactone decarboxylase family protein [Gemmatimonas sp.]